MVAHSVALDGHARFGKQRGRLGRQRTETFGTDPGIGMFGRLTDRLAHRLRRSGHGRAVGQRPQQIERPRREVQRALPRRDNGAAPARFRKADAADEPREAAADDYTIEFHIVISYCFHSLTRTRRRRATS